MSIARLDYRAISQELFRTIRGRRSQRAFSTRLGYRTNAVHNWESGRRFPAATEGLRALKLAGYDVVRAVEEFTAPASISAVVRADLVSGEIANWLEQLRGSSSIGVICARSGLTRFQVSRWLSGKSEPRFPDFLCYLEATTFRALDFVACFVDPDELPHARVPWAETKALRALAYEHPHSEAIVRSLEMALARHLVGASSTWISHQLGLEIAKVDEALVALRAASIVEHKDGLWFVRRDRAVDTRADSEAVRRLKQHWAQYAADAVGRPDSLHSYVVACVGEAELAQIRKLHLAYFEHLRRIIAESKGDDRVVLANVQLMPLSLARETEA